MASTSPDEKVRELAVKLCEVITEARAMSASANTMPQANRAGRIVTKAVKLFPDVLAIPPIILSCAMALSTCSEYVENRPSVVDKPSITIVRVPDWGAIGYDDYRIMQHPLHNMAKIWMAGLGEAKDVMALKVLKNEFDWQTVLREGAYLQEGLGRPKDGEEANMSHQFSTEETVGEQGALQMPKPRVFGAAKRKAADRKGKKVERGHEDAEPGKGNDQGVVTKNTQQHLSDERDRKRMRTSHMFAEDGLMEGSSNKLKHGGATALKKLPAMEPTETVTEAVCDDHCTSCDKRGLKCVFGYSKKSGKKLNSCEECTRKKQKCFYGREPDIVARGRRRARSQANSRVRSKTRTGSPTASRPTSKVALPSPSSRVRSKTRTESPTASRGRPTSKAALPSRSQRPQSISTQSPRIVSSDIPISSVPPIPAPEVAVINSMEGRLVILEEGLAKLNTAIEKLGEEHEALRQKVLPQHPTFPLPHGPSLPPIQTPRPGKPRSVPLATPPIRRPLLIRGSNTGSSAGRDPSVGSN
ncbi:hypothetical protein BD769DRAFT_1664929 [Suillus cothurnatus]|nr:hypothetical protein BD769DRAFT_1664929 [Suillus cothurnatus]